MSEIIRLDFGEDILLGYEIPKYIEVIDSLIMAIKARIELPVFSVFKIGEREYSLSPEEKVEVDGKQYVDGGHHRSIAFYKEQGFAFVNLVGVPNIPNHMLTKGFIDIKNIPLVSSQEEYLKRKERYGKYI